MLEGGLGDGSLSAGKSRDTVLKHLETCPLDLVGNPNSKVFRKAVPKRRYLFGGTSLEACWRGSVQENCAGCLLLTS